ncbi:MAG TPA: hypothetical protein PKD05_11670 [Candidatus Melainabacteria bacterium]|nr:hypothetical protein [Candidatus Melainabacteria bacterium]
MRIRHMKRIALLGVMVISMFPVAGMAETMTIWQRQKALMTNINQGQKNNQLTDSEAKSLRKKLSAVSKKKTKMKRDAEDGKLSSENVIELEKDLNDISVEIKKLRLEKRVKVLEKQKEKEDGGKKRWWKKL